MVRHYVAGICFALALTACQTQPERVIPIPEPVVIKVDCTAEFPDWVFEPVDVPWMDAVRDMGGTNRALLSAFNLQKLLLESVNVRLAKILELHRDAIERCRRAE